MNILVKSTFIVSFCTLISRILGYVRDMIIAVKLGTSILNDAFVVTFRLTNMFRNIFAEGALNLVFVPEFSQVLQKKGKKEALIFASKIHSLLLVILAVFCLLIIIMMPELIWYTTPGFRNNTYIYNMAVLFGRITFPYLFCISLAAFYGGILNSFNKFFPFAIVPAILNLSTIFGLLFFDKFQTSAHTLSISILIAGILELLWMIYFLWKHSYRLQFIKLQINPRVTGVLKNMLPVILASGITHINAWVSIIVLSFFPGGLSYVYYADRITQLPLALIGTAVGTVLLPTLAKKSEDKEQAFVKVQNNAINLVMFLTIPATVGLLFLSQDIIHVLFERGKFTHNSTIETAKVLLLLSIGLPAFILTKLFQTKFYATLNTRLPVVIAVICIFINLVISISLMRNLQYLGVAIANSVSGWVNFILLLIFAKRKLRFKLYVKTIVKSVKYFTASLAMIFALWCFKNSFYFLNKYLFLILEISLGLIVYLSFCYFLKIRSMSLWDVNRECNEPKNNQHSSFL